MNHNIFLDTHKLTRSIVQVSPGSSKYARIMMEMQKILFVVWRCVQMMHDIIWYDYWPIMS